MTWRMSQEIHRKWNIKLMGCCFSLKDTHRDQITVFPLNGENKFIFGILTSAPTIFCFSFFVVLIALLYNCHPPSHENGTFIEFCSLLLSALDPVFHIQMRKYHGILES